METLEGYYKYGWVAVTLYWVTVPATIFSVAPFAKKWRRARIDHLRLPQPPQAFLSGSPGPGGAGALARRASNRDRLAG